MFILAGVVVIPISGIISWVLIRQEPPVFFEVDRNLSVFSKAFHVALRYEVLILSRSCHNHHTSLDLGQHVLKDFIVVFHAIIQVDADHLICEVMDDFIRNGDRREYRAAAALLRELSEQNRQAGGVIRCAQWRWEGVSRKVKFNPGRLQMKRFLSVMANTKLRKIYFGF